jgi:sugar (pentulose or hexulose) kinase
LSREPVILIFDIGKTTKKALIFDPSFRVLEERTEIFKETTDDDGFPAEDLALVSDWVISVFRDYMAHSKFQITHCNISAYGASLVHLDEKSEPLAPFYNYLKPFPASTKLAFFSTYGSETEISRVTASPFLGLLNSGLQLFWLKQEKSLVFKSIKTSLHLPQYFTWLLTGRPFTDITSIGCHTMLWNFDENRYHDWVNAEDIANLFPKVHQADHVFDIFNDKDAIKMGIGVHDSSAALMPYLVTQREPFLLLSTGTWNICFNPFNSNPLTHDELAGDCLSYITFEGHPVKASRIFLGHEYEVQVEALSKHFQIPAKAFSSIEFDEKVYSELVRQPLDRPFYPLGMEGTGPMPGKPKDRTNLIAFKSFNEAYLQMVRYLVQWQLMSVDLVDPECKVKSIIIVGGFTKNSPFLEILKRVSASRKIKISDHPRASALGAAWLVSGKAAYKDKEDLLTVKDV